MNVLSLFSGIGGLELGLERAGMRTVGQCEIDADCRFWLEQHWPGVPRWSDIREVTGDAVEAACGAIDVVAGGPPCQPASVAGRRQGAADMRWLWPEFLRVCREVAPAWVVAENPLGLASLEPQGLDWVCCELEASGYEVWPVVVGAEHVGAPHRRHRIWIVAHTNRGIRRPQAWESPLHEKQDLAAYQQGGNSECNQTRSSMHASWPKRPGEVGTIPPETDGLPAGLAGLTPAHRRAALKALGNAVVPQVAEVVGRAILEAEAELA